VQLRLAGKMGVHLNQVERRQQGAEGARAGYPHFWGMELPAVLNTVSQKLCQKVKMHRMVNMASQLRHKEVATNSGIVSPDIGPADKAVLARPDEVVNARDALLSPAVATDVFTAVRYGKQGRESVGKRGENDRILRGPDGAG
jgi:hypothetical protein